MNINRQAGRRRGRGGQRQGGGNPNNGNGNRIDNRARGNANQLYEKYKTLAADAQRQGDRVNTEYYLQFADHYFRVLAETRSRFEEQNPGQAQRRTRDDAFDDEDENFEDDGNDGAAEEPRRDIRARDNGRDSQPRDTGRDRDDRGNRDMTRDHGRDRDDRGNRFNGNGRADNDADDVTVEAREPREEREPRPERQPREVQQPREMRPASDDRSQSQPRRGRPRRDERPVEPVEGETFDAALLPPSLGISVGDEGEAAPKPRRRRARPAEAADAAE